MRTQARPATIIAHTGLSGRTLLGLCMGLALPQVLYWLIAAPTLAGHYIGDDFPNVHWMYDQSERGVLIERLARMWTHGLESTARMYRPWPMLVYALEYRAFGADPVMWRFTSLLLHAANGVLVATLALVLVPRNHAMRWFAAGVASALFLVFPASAEIAVWASARQDSWALFFVLMALIGFWKHQTLGDRWSVLSLFAGAMAFASKESAAVLPLFIVAFSLMQACANGASSLRSIALRIAKRAWPWLALTVLYFILRLAVYGSPFEVYKGTAPTQALLSGRWWPALAGIPAWFSALVPGPAPRRIAIALFAMLMVWALVRASRGQRIAVAVLLVAAVACFAMVLPHVGVPLATGEGGRHLYASSLAAALCVALALTVHDRARWSQVAIGIALIVVLTLSAQQVYAHWRNTTLAMRNVLVALPAIAAQLRANKRYALIIVPDHIGSSVFARNAQGGMVLPPFQQESLSDALVPTLLSDLPRWYAWSASGMIDDLKRVPLLDVVRREASGAYRTAQPQGEFPAEFYCVQAASRNLVRMMIAPDTSDAAAWVSTIYVSLAATGCEHDALPAGSR